MVWLWFVLLFDLLKWWVFFDIQLFFFSFFKLPVILNWSLFFYHYWILFVWFWYNLGWLVYFNVRLIFFTFLCFLVYLVIVLLVWHLDLIIEASQKVPTRMLRYLLFTLARLLWYFGIIWDCFLLFLLIFLISNFNHDFRKVTSIVSQL